MQVTDSKQKVEHISSSSIKRINAAKDSRKIQNPSVDGSTALIKRSNEHKHKNVNLTARWRYNSFYPKPQNYTAPMQ